MEKNANRTKQELYPKDGEVTFFMPNTNAIGILKNAEVSGTLTSKYMTVEDWEQLKGVEMRCVFQGFKDAEDSKGQPYHLAKLHDGEKPFVAAQKILVDALSRVPIGQGVLITCTDIVKNSNSGKTVLFNIDRLDFNIFEQQGDE